jgi:hypothetical protein
MGTACLMDGIEPEDGGGSIAEVCTPAMTRGGWVQRDGLALGVVARTAGRSSSAGFRAAQGAVSATAFRGASFRQARRAASL